MGVQTDKWRDIYKNMKKKSATKQIR